MRTMALQEEREGGLPPRYEKIKKIRNVFGVILGIFQSQICCLIISKLAVI
jgi:hypothetical protein